MEPDATAFTPPVDADATRAMPPIPPRPEERPLYRDEVGVGSETAVIDLNGVDAPDTRRWWTRLPVLVGAGFAALLVAAGSGAFLIGNSGSGPSADAAGDYDPALVANEEADPEPLDPDTLFSQSTVTLSDGNDYELLLVDTTEDCAEGTHGTYGDVLAEHDCRQLVRATYTAEDDNHAVTVGVAALATAEDAEEAQEGQDIAATEWFAGLPGPEDSGTEHLSYAGGHGSGATWGRYLVFALATAGDGQPTSQEAAELAEISDQFLQVPLAQLGERARG